MRKSAHSFLLIPGILFIALKPVAAKDAMKNPIYKCHLLLRTFNRHSFNPLVTGNKIWPLFQESITRKPFPLDTIINPNNVTTGALDVKVILSNGEEGIELTPLSSMNNGGLIQPINRNTNKGISTTFYLSDSSYWKFYTNGQERLNINGAGNIITRSPLLINKAEPDNNAVLRVNGVARFDSLIKLQGPVDTSSFITMNRNVKRDFYDPYDGYSPYTTTPTAWANGGNIPVFRLRHPNKNDFMILPYQYGTAIEYNGVVECWVGEWSIHKGFKYYDVEQNGNGWGAVLWVGNDEDVGGIRATARNNLYDGGNVHYGELSVERFLGTPDGDMRFRLPSIDNSFQFIYGGRGSNNMVAKVSDKGFFLPKIASVSGITNPEKAQLVFDSTENQLKAYNGTVWVSLTDNGKTGSSTFSADGNTVAFFIAHGLGTAPSYFNVIATSSGAANISYITADASFLVIHYRIPPPSGTNTLSFNWQAKP